MMNILRKVAVAVLLSSGLLASASVSAYQLADIGGSMNTDDVLFSVEDGVAILAGSVPGLFDKASLELAAAKLEGVTEVYSYLEVGE